MEKANFFQEKKEKKGFFRTAKNSGFVETCDLDSPRSCKKTTASQNKRRRDITNI